MNNSYENEYKNECENECVICMLTLHKEDAVFLECCHSFHYDCILYWYKHLEMQKSDNIRRCPTCNTNSGFLPFPSDVKGKVDDDCVYDGIHYNISYINDEPSLIDKPSLIDESSTINNKHPLPRVRAPDGWTTTKKSYDVKVDASTFNISKPSPPQQNNNEKIKSETKKIKKGSGVCTGTIYNKNSKNCGGVCGKKATYDNNTRCGFHRTRA